MRNTDFVFDVTPFDVDTELPYNGVHMLYFAYGSNCNIESLHRYLVQHDTESNGVLNPRRAILDHFRLRTNYVRVGSTGAANIEPAEGKRVEGVLMDISHEVHLCLRRKEGYPRRYRETMVFVHLPRSRQLIMAMTYIVAEGYRLRTDMPVLPCYRETILEGAKRAGFTQKYQRHLSRVLRIA